MMIAKMAKGMKVAGLTALMALVVLPLAGRADYTLNLDDLTNKSSLKNYTWDGSTTDINVGDASFRIKAMDYQNSSTAVFKFQIEQLCGCGELAKIKYTVADSTNFNAFLPAPGVFFRLDVDPHHARMSTQGNYTVVLPGPNVLPAILTANNKNPTAQTTEALPDDSLYFNLSISKPSTIKFKRYCEWQTSTLTVDPQAVPEPASILMGLIGLPFMGTVSRFVRRRSKPGLK